MSKASQSPTEEYQAYLRMKPELLKRGLEGKFVLVKDGKLAGTFDNDVAAYAEGLRLFGNVPFLIIRVSKEEATTFIPALVLGLVNARV